VIDGDMKQLFIILLPALFFQTSISAKALDHPWGTHIADIKSALESMDGGTVTECTPEDQVAYKNRIYSFIVSIDELAKQNITVLKFRGYGPAKDYLFYKYRLVSIMESYPRISYRSLKKMTARLQSQLGKPTRDNNKNFYVLTYKGKKSRAMLYVKHISPGSLKIRLYLYDRKLFIKMMMD
jgi:hypothetical protein